MNSAEIRYLLGTISPEEALKLEEGYFADSARFEQLEIAEEELIEAYVRNQLSSEEAQQFETRLLRYPRIGERVNFARALSEKVKAYELSSKRRSEKEDSIVPWWQRFLPEQPALRVAFAACFLIFAIGGLISIPTWLRLRSESDRITSERAALQKQTEELDKRALQMQGQNEQLTADLRRQEDELAQQRQRIDDLQRALASRQPDRGLPGVLASVFLYPGSTRGPEETRELAIYPNTSRAQISLGLESNEYKTYRAVLKTAARSVVLSRNGLSVRNPALPQIHFVIPAHVLTAGTYLITVSGRTPTGEFEDVADYTLRVARK